MRKLMMMTAMLSLAAGAAMAEPLLGMWRTAGDDNGNSGLVQVAPCGAALCGKLVKSFNSAGEEIPSDNIGRNIISGTVPTGDGEYRGKVYSPDRGKTYNSRLQLNGDSLKVSGCVLGICRDGGTWQRVK
ncbi:MAG: imidazoleglycerol-phosphate dehydratase [Roseovarius sp.]|nr:imidazoleglycerol-phosphate dehydratase [Roseovarius sp.]